MTRPHFYRYAVLEPAMLRHPVCLLAVGVTAVKSIICIHLGKMLGQISLGHSQITKNAKKESLINNNNNWINV